MEENFTVPITRPQSFQSPPPSQKQEVTFPTEVIELPSKGFFYKENDPLSSGKVELKMMTAKEEDILTSENLIKKGVVLDKLLESLIVDKSIKIENILIGDKNALYVAARRLAYGDSYGPVGIVCKNCKEESKIDINLAELKDKDFDFSKYSKSENSLSFTLPYSKKLITVKLATTLEEQQIENELKSISKLNKGGQSAEITTRLKHVITAIDGNTDKVLIRKFVDTELLSRDSIELRRFIRQNSPDLDMTFNFTCPNCNSDDRSEVPMTVQFFWPNN
jgi:hypothetical protein